jgi:hypothetical protein
MVLGRRGTAGVCPDPEVKEHSCYWQPGLKDGQLLLWLDDRLGHMGICHVRQLTMRWKLYGMERLRFFSS